MIRIPTSIVFIVMVAWTLVASPFDTSRSDTSLSDSLSRKRMFLPVSPSANAWPFLACASRYPFLAALTLNQQSPNQVSTSVTLSKSTLQIAEPFTVTFIVTAPLGTKVNFPTIADRWGEFEVLDQRDQFDVPDSKNPNMRTWKRQLELESLTTGELTIPSLEIQSRFAPNARWESFRSKAETVTIVSVLENQSDPLSFRDIKSEVDADVPTPTSYAWLGWMVAGLGGLAALGFALITMVKRKRWIDAKPWALRELRSLEHSQAVQHAEAEPVFAQIETTLNRILETQLEIPASKMTSAELVDALKAEQGGSKSADVLAVLLNQAEQVKYAGQKFDSEKLGATVRAAIAWVEETEFERETLSASKPSKRSEAV